MEIEPYESEETFDLDSDDGAEEFGEDEMGEIDIGKQDDESYE